MYHTVASKLVAYTSTILKEVPNMCPPAHAQDPTHTRARARQSTLNDAARRRATELLLFAYCW